MSELKAYCFDETDTVVATDPADALKIIEETYGEVADWHTNHPPVELPPDKLLRINLDDTDTPGNFEHTVAEWIAKCGRGFLCSTEF